MWEERYAADEYVYGTDPNVFLQARVADLPMGLGQGRGRVLCLADGEGRNGVWLAEQGYDVTSVDGAANGVNKTKKLAASRGVDIIATQADLADYDLGAGVWDGIVSVFAHLPSRIRADLHRRCVAGLKPGGVMLLEAYTPEQLHYGTGGPPDADMMLTATLLRQELAGLEFVFLEEVLRDIREGTLHGGMGAVVQMIARK